MNLEGRLEIDLYRRAGGVDVEVQSTYPPEAATVFWGKQVEQVLVTLPQCFRLCATAQAMAAATACEQAMGIRVSSVQARARELLVLAETVREHMFRILLDWPAFVSRRAGAAVMRAMDRLPVCVRAALYPRDNPFQLGAGPVAVNRHELALCLDDAQQFVEARVFAIEFDEWQTIDGHADLLCWAESSASIAAALIRHVVRKGWSGFGCSQVSALPRLDDEQLHRCLDSPAAADFISRPQWRGMSYDTSAFSRQFDSPLVGKLRKDFGNGLLPRLTARLHELVAYIGRMRSLAHDLERDPGHSVPERVSGSGLAQVETARGRLIHRVEVDNGRVKRYQMIAPGGWNFHPQGLLAQSLRGRCTGDREDLFRKAMLLVNAIDPCVDYRLRVH
jgi:hypothetical protein